MIEFLFIINVIGIRLTANRAFLYKDFISCASCLFRFFFILANVADVKSLVIHPATTTHSQLSPEELAEQDIKPNTIRLSIGTEHIDDIIHDLDEAFAAID
jgi:O-acetylhomoserine/O-acetylserine sulfhydrylase-like pyridoxal-dependent enzyme